MLDEKELAEGVNHYPKLNREGLILVNEKKLSGIHPPASVLDAVKLNPKYNLEIFPEAIRSRLEGKIQRLQVGLYNPFRRILPGDVILDLKTGKKVVVQEDTRIIEYREPRELIVVKNGQATEPFVRLTEKGEKEIGREPTPFGRISNFEISGYFQSASVIAAGGLKIEFSFSGALGESTSTTKEKPEDVLERQALSAVATKDGRLILPKTYMFGDLVVTDPKKLAEFIYRSQIYHSATEVFETIQLADICWILSHDALKKVVSQYSYNDLMEDPSEGLPKKAVEEAVFKAIDLHLTGVGITRVPQAMDVHFSEREGASHKAKILHRTVGAHQFAKLIAAKIQPFFATPHVSPEKILALNPDLKTSEKVVIPASLRLSGFDRLVYSALKEAEGVQEIGSRILQKDLRKELGDDEGAKAWFRMLMNRIASPGDFFNKQWAEKIAGDLFPKLQDYWQKLETTYHQLAPQRSLITPKI